MQRRPRGSAQPTGHAAATAAVTHSPDSRCAAQSAPTKTSAATAAAAPQGGRHTRHVTGHSLRRSAPCAAAWQCETRVAVRGVGGGARGGARPRDIGRVVRTCGGRLACSRVRRRAVGSGRGAHRAGHAGGSAFVPGPRVRGAAAVWGGVLAAVGAVGGGGGEGHSGGYESVWAGIMSRGKACVVMAGVGVVCGNWG